MPPVREAAGSHHHPEPASGPLTRPAEEPGVQPPDAAGAGAEEDDHRRGEEQVKALLSEAHPLGREPEVEGEKEPDQGRETRQQAEQQPDSHHHLAIGLELREDRGMRENGALEETLVPLHGELGPDGLEEPEAHHDSQQDDPAVGSDHDDLDLTSGGAAPLPPCPPPDWSTAQRRCNWFTAPYGTTAGEVPITAPGTRQKATGRSAPSPAAGGRPARSARASKASQGAEPRT